MSECMLEECLVAGAQCAFAVANMKAYKSIQMQVHLPFC